MLTIMLCMSVMNVRLLSNFRKPVFNLITTESFKKGLFS